MKYRVQDNKKNPSGGMDVCVACFKVKTKGKMQDKKTKEEIRMEYREHKTKIPQKHGCLRSVSVVFSGKSL